MIYIGIDPGLDGGIAAFDDTGILILAEAMPTMGGLKAGSRMVDGLKLSDLLKISNEACALIERVNAMPKQGVTSSFNFGMSFGIAICAVASLGIGYDFVLPREWKKHYGLTRDKQQSIALVNRRWPRLNLEKKDDGIAEAILIADYLRMNRR